MSEKPNIVLVTIDSLRADHCSFMGYERETTPNLDAMAEQGIVFENAVASGVPTVASMTAVMTGEHSLASPELGNAETQREHVTTRRKIAEVLSEVEYSTGALVPNPPASSYFGFDEGFDWFEDFLAQDRGMIERAWNQVFRNSMEKGGVSMYLRLFKNVATKDEILRPWTDFHDEILAWRKSLEEPYFLWVLLLEPHHPWMPPTEYQRWSSRLDKYRAFQQYFELFTNGWEPDFDGEVHERLVDLYDDSIRYGDAFLDRLRTDLADDDPVFIVHADHGEEFGEHGRYGHQPHLTEELIHVPLVISGLNRSSQIRRPVGLRSIAPTVAELAGTSHAFTAPSLLDGRTPWVESKVFTDKGRRLSIRTDQLKYRQNGSEGLYDLSGESYDRQDVSEEPDVVGPMSSLADRHVINELEKRSIRESSSEVVSDV